MLELILPREEFIETYYQGCVESWGHLHENYIMHNPAEYDKWKYPIIKDYENHAQGIDLPEGCVPNLTYWFMEDNVFIGVVNIRIELNDKLIEYGGSCGAALIPRKRGMGYGTKLTNMAFHKMQELKISPILLCCEESNIASWHTMEHFKFTRMEKYKTMIHGKMTPVRRYWYYDEDTKAQS